MCCIGHLDRGGIMMMLMIMTEIINEDVYVVLVSTLILKYLNIVYG